MKIGVFDSGYGGLTILKGIRRLLPEYDYLYLGDNARAPYGTRSFDVVYRYTRQAVKTLMQRDCQLVILACNTASAKALRSIQQNDLPSWGKEKRVLGIIIPTVQALEGVTKTGTIGVMGTPGTISSGSYDIEIAKAFPAYRTVSQACPMWVSLVENEEAQGSGADYFVKKYVDELFAQASDIDTILLGCTHYPLLLEKIEQAVGKRATVLTQGEIVAQSLKKYLENHPEIEGNISRESSCTYLTTENAKKFSEQAQTFLSERVKAQNIEF